MIEKFALKDKYLIEKKLQESKLGKTFLAKSKVSDEICIIKTVRINKADPSDKTINIQNEAKILSNLNHKNIPKLIEIFTEENDNKIDIFLVQKYIPGLNLQHLIDKGQKFSEKETINIAIKISDILEYIHSFSPAIIHQDIKPVNIIISNNNDVNLIDFGAAKHKILEENQLHHGLSTIVGTQGYMALEQFEGNPVPASDIYSLGLTMLAMLTGKHPLLLDKIGLNFDFKNLKISQSLKDILEKMTNPDWQKRYKSAKDLKENLELFDADNNQEKNIFFSKKSVENIVKEQVAPDEKLKFFIKSKSLIDLSFNNYPKSSWVYGVVTFVFLIISAFSYIDFSNNKVFGLTSFLSLILVISTLSFIFIKLQSVFKNNTYIITNKRVMLINSEGNYRKVQSYNNQDIKGVEIINIYNNGKYGDISVLRNNNQSFLIKKIENVQIVYKLLKEIIDKNESSEQI